jgi:hypothetical protein
MGAAMFTESLGVTGELIREGRTTPAADEYSMLCTKAFGVTAQAGAFGELEQGQSDWDQPHTRHERLDQLATKAYLNQFPPVKPLEVLDGAGAAIHALGGCFTMRYTRLLATARRTDAPGPGSRCIRCDGKPRRGRRDATGAISTRPRPGPLKRLSRCGRTSPSSWGAASSRDSSTSNTLPGSTVTPRYSAPSLKAAVSPLFSSGGS